MTALREPSGALEPTDDPSRTADVAGRGSGDAPRTAAPRYALIDGLRLVAAVMVMLYHYTAKEWGDGVWGRRADTLFPNLWQVTQYGQLGVNLFFLISGFVILMSCWGRTLPEFVASRLSRLLPAYWVAVTLTALLLGVIWTTQKTVTFSQYAVNLTMLQVPMGVDHVDGVYWTLWIELLFYLLIGIFLLVGITETRVLAFAALWPVAGLVAQRSGNSLLTSILQPGTASFFAGGMLIFLLARSGWRSPITWLLLGVNLMLSVRNGQDVIAQITASTEHPSSRAVCGWLVVGFYAVVMLAVLTPLRRINWTWLTWAGLLTYPLYLISEYWGLWLLHVLHPIMPARLVLVLTCVAMLALAWVIHRVAERPFHRRMRVALLESMNRMRTPASR